MLFSTGMMCLTGHNWGSEHDPDNSKCSPSTSHGGKYLMYMYSVSGMDSNNKVWIICVLQFLCLYILMAIFCRDFDNRKSLQFYTCRLHWIHVVRWRNYFYHIYGHCIMTTCCACRNHCHYVRVLSLVNWRAMTAYVLGYFCSSKHSSKQEWQSSSYFITFILAMCTHNMAEATLNIDIT